MESVLLIFLVFCVVLLCAITFLFPCFYVRYYSRKGQSKMYNPEKWIQKGTVDEDKQNENTTQDVLDTTMHKPTQIT
jgi:hypothetical protein